MNRTITFKSDSHDHVDTSSHTNMANRIQKLRIQNDQGTCRQMKSAIKNVFLKIGQYFKKSHLTTHSRSKFSLLNKIAELVIELNIFVI